MNFDLIGEARASAEQHERDVQAFRISRDGQRVADELRNATRMPRPSRMRRWEVWGLAPRRTRGA